MLNETQLPSYRRVLGDLVMDGELVQAIRAIAHGDDMTPGGIEGLTMAFADIRREESVSGSLDRIATAIDRLAAAVEGLVNDDS